MFPASWYITEIINGFTVQRLDPEIVERLLANGWDRVSGISPMPEPESETVNAARQ